jgi:hypothetical protein
MEKNRWWRHVYRVCSGIWSMSAVRIYGRRCQCERACVWKVVSRTKGNCEENPWRVGRHDSSGPNNHMWRLASNPDVGRRFLVYKGRTTKDERTTGYRLRDYRQTYKRIDAIVNRPIDKNCIGKSRIKILSYLLFHQPGVEDPII